ncbi:MAG: cytochrome c [Chitinophagales bacterium]|nr:cytochrome c [Chitinophagales bacterium]MDW8418031.1 c-type cytochrome [Chitinophagales bacterium]
MLAHFYLLHKIFATLFFVHYVIKLALLLTNRQNPLAVYTQKTKIAEMIISVGFLVTGVVLAINAPLLGNMFLVKLILVFASIPLAIVGFKRSNKLMALVAVLFIAGAYGIAEMSKKKKAGGAVDTSRATSSIETGKLVYIEKCAACHGTDGKQGLGGAKDLSASILTEEQTREIILQGKNTMPGFKNVLTEQQVQGLLEYLRTLRQ